MKHDTATTQGISAMAESFSGVARTITAPMPNSTACTIMKIKTAIPNLSIVISKEVSDRPRKTRETSISSALLARMAGQLCDCVRASPA
jgi:hypothetical protein